MTTKTHTPSIVATLAGPAFLLAATLLGGTALAADYIGIDGSSQSCTDCYCSVDDYGNEVVRSSDGSVLAPVAVSADGSCNCVDTQNGAIYVPLEDELETAEYERERGPASN